MTAGAAIRQALAADPALAGVTAGRVLRDRPGRIVAEGRLGGLPVILKLFTGPDAGGTVLRLRAEHDRLAHLATGRLRVPRCLLASPRAGLAVLSHLPGAPLSLVLPQAAPQERARLVADAGALFLAYAAGRQAPGALGPAHWLRRADLLAAPGQAALFADLRAALARQGRRLKGAPLCRAAVHGDFVPVNLMAADDSLAAFDFQGEAVMPLSHDAAAFLAWLAIDRPPPGPHWLGVPEADRAAFLAAGLPVAGEHPGVLAFFLGLQIARRLSEGMPGASAAARRYLEGIDRAE